MSTLLPPNQFLFADEHPLTADTAAALVTSPPAAAANILPDPPSNEGGGYQGAPADDYPFDAGATDHIHEIFYHARKLMDHRFVLDEAAFMEAIEPPPLFIQRATG